MTEIPPLTLDSRRHIECEIGHDLRENEDTGPDRIRWNNRAMIILLGHIAKLERLVVHCQIHSGYRQCGRSQMTTEQQELFDEIDRRSDRILS